MKTRLRCVMLLLAASICIAALPADAQTLSIEGNAVQSELLVGRTDAGASVRVNGQATRVSPDGLFLIGLDRDATGAIVIETKNPAGQSLTKRISIKKRAYDIQRIDGLPERAVTPKPEDTAKITADSEALKVARNKDTPGLSLLHGFVWPVKGTVSGVFGSQRILNGKPRQAHRGIDIAAAAGTPVLAMADGTVSLRVDDMFFTGRTVAIDHGHGLSSVYAHMQSVAVKEGEHVKAGQAIGAVGQSGRATGPHLHWGVSLFDAFLDPERLSHHPLLVSDAKPAAAQKKPVKP